MTILPPSPMAPLYLTTPDGRRLAYYDTGGDGQVIALANGLGGPFSAWRYQVDYLGDRYRFVSWDYRGLHRSAQGTPPADVSIHQHVRDMECVLNAAGVEAATVMGWSMGVQVALEFYARHRPRVHHLMLLNGTYGRPLHTMPMPASGWWAPIVLDVARHLGPPAESLMRRASRWPEVVTWAKRLGLVSSTVEDRIFQEVAAEFGTMDLDVYFRTLRAIGDHDASHLLESVEVPALVITGERDRMTPSGLSENMAHRLPRGELLSVRGATHYAALEFPELINLRIEKFLREHPISTVSRTDEPAAGKGT